ncbi:uncharacterized protein APUU_61443A [Aspergillus puulaauensis]|uniref:Uncharacterized protein n=1 Tax=Aspergillus puulaauensis TaxID=1220207 RepID=A0A7R7XVA3_9EURO|nr:uncharacterized protein APUU_61443A [Aspergillus puulaauensis]BCS28395.1 hypothetical protein APUU_61443A [Aspergillus puulaauensis]
MLRARREARLGASEQYPRSLENRAMSLSFDNIEEASMPGGFWKKWSAKAASKAEQKQIEKMMKGQDKQDQRSRRRAGRGSSRRQNRQEGKKAKEVHKILWIVITTHE